MNQNRKTALITGASRGLGLAVARALAQQGWQLIINARGEAAMQDALTEMGLLTRVTAVSGDISDPLHRDALAAAAKTMGGVDAVINNAGSLGVTPLPPLLDYPLDELTTLFHVNVTAQLGVLQALRHQLKPHATIINVTSDAAVSAYEGWGGYGASKRALEQLTAVFAAENRSWRVYTVDPGDMRTQMHQEAFPGEDISDRPLPERSVPGFLALLNGNYANGRYQAQSMPTPQEKQENRHEQQAVIEPTL
jgi:NAD(P)-dependent dehydrogenase (short-subunit alcohol dehydrogenase family)